MSEPTPEDLAEAVAGRWLSGGLTPSRKSRLMDLFEETRNPPPIEVYHVWYGSTPTTSDEAVSQSAGRSSSGFDPEEDSANNLTRSRVKRVYGNAVEAGFDKEAEYLRQLSHSNQNEFARFLQSCYIENDLQDHATAQEETQKAERLKEF